MKKTLVILALGVTSIVVLAGCGKKKEEIDIPKSEATTTEETSASSQESNVKPGDTEASTEVDLSTINPEDLTVEYDENGDSIDYSDLANTYGEDGTFTFMSDLAYTGGLDRSGEKDGRITGQFTSESGVNVGVMIYDLASEGSQYKGQSKDDIIQSVISGIGGVTMTSDNVVDLSDNISEARVLVGTSTDNTVFVTVAGYGDNPDENGNPTRVKVVVTQTVLTTENAEEYLSVWGSMK